MSMPSGPGTAGSARSRAAGCMTPEALRARREVRSRRARRCARRRVVALLMLVALTSFLVAFTARHHAAPSAVDRHSQSKRIERYSNAELGFSLRYPASLVLRETPRDGRDDGRHGVRLVFRTDGDGGGALAVTVYEASRERDFSRGEAVELVHDLRDQVATSLPDTYREREGVRDVRVEGVRTTTLAGLPAIVSRVELTMRHGTVVRLERSDCLSGRLVFAFEAVFGKGDVETRARLLAVISSLTCDAKWRREPGAGATWVRAFSLNRTSREEARCGHRV